MILLFITCDILNVDSVATKLQDCHGACVQNFSQFTVSSSINMSL